MFVVSLTEGITFESHNYRLEYEYDGKVIVFGRISEYSHDRALTAGLALLRDFHRLCPGFRGVWIKELEESR